MSSNEFATPENRFKFLLEVFEEVNGHIRSTERKSLLLAGAYIGLISAILFRLADSDKPVDVEQVFLTSVLLALGCTVAIVKDWYRSWKKHYIAVCIAIKKTVLPEGENPDVLPVWLRGTEKSVAASSDALVTGIIHAANMLQLALLCLKISQLGSDRVAMIAGILGAVLYWVVYLLAKKLMRDRLALN